jgi:hypothetical protein
MSNLANDPLFSSIDDVFPDDISDHSDAEEMPRAAPPPPKKFKRTTFAPQKNKRPHVQRPVQMMSHPRPAQIDDDDESSDEEIENFDNDEVTSITEIISFLQSMSVFLLIIFIATFLFTQKKFKDFVLGYIPEAVENSHVQSLIISGAVTSSIAVAFILNKLRLISF